MIEVPQNVCASDGVLHWSPVPYADGYNLHSLGDYVFSIKGNENTIFNIPEGMQGPFSVSAWTLDADGTSSHTARSSDACGLFDPYSDFSLVIDERFSNLTDNEWLPKFPYWNNTINNELQRYTARSLSAGDGGLVISAKKNLVHLPLPADADPEDQTLTPETVERWESGLISWPTEKSFLYGYFEADIEAPTEKGTWPAFWLLNEKYTGIRPELDILEVVGGKAYQSYHSWHPEKNSRSSYVDALEGFNKYGVLWEKNRITWYINRMPVFTTFGDHVSNQPMYPIINLAIGGTWPGDPDEGLEHVEMRVRSLKVWN